MLRPVRKRVALAEHDLGPRVADAVVEILLGEAPRKRHADSAHPLAGPVEEHRLEPVVEHERNAVAGLDAEATGDARDPRQQLLVGDAGERLGPRGALAGVEQRPGEIHGPSFRSRASSIAATIGA